MDQIAPIPQEMMDLVSLICGYDDSQVACVKNIIDRLSSSLCDQ
jgi:hypothetical protein